LSHLLAAILHALSIAGAVWTWQQAWWPATILLWGAIAWMNHAALTRLHEAAHAMLSRRMWLNELQGFIIGTAALTPLSVYRYVHARHHAALGNPNDPEFWPYNLPDSPRWLRLLYAWSELIAGWPLTPALYSFRTAISWKRVPRRQHSRLIAEWIILIGVWSGLLWLVNRQGWWEPFIVAFVVPAWLAGTMQTIRKFTEHLGMFGCGIIAMTRTVVYRAPLGRAASASQLHVEHHATHHRYARIPYYALPEATELVYADAPEGRVFPSHFRAILDMLPWLLDPRLGPQWLATNEAPNATGEPSGLRGALDTRQKEQKPRCRRDFLKRGGRDSNPQPPDRQSQNGGFTIAA